MEILSNRKGGDLILTGAEANAQANARAEEANQRADAECRQREDLLRKLHAAGIDPDKL